MAAGQVIFRQGDAGDGLYLVVSGRLRVSVAADDGPERMLYDVGRGAIVGEMALLTDRPRAATVHAVRDSDLLLLRVSSFTSLLERSPALVTGMIRLLVDRLLAVDRLLVVDRPRAPGAGRPHHRRGLRRPRRPRRRAGRRAAGRPAGSGGLGLPGGRRRGRARSWARTRRSGGRARAAGPS